LETHVFNRVVTGVNAMTKLFVSVLVLAWVVTAVIALLKKSE
jgi:hypothetical protein